MRIAPIPQRKRIWLSPAPRIYRDPIIERRRTSGFIDDDISAEWPILYEAGLLIIITGRFVRKDRLELIVGPIKHVGLRVNEVVPVGPTLRRCFQQQQRVGMARTHEYHLGGRQSVGGRKPGARGRVWSRVLAVRIQFLNKAHGQRSVINRIAEDVGKRTWQGRYDKSPLGLRCEWTGQIEVINDVTALAMPGRERGNYTSINFVR